MILFFLSWLRYCPDDYNDYSRSASLSVSAINNADILLSLTFHDIEADKINNEGYMNDDKYIQEISWSIWITGPRCE